MITTPACCPTSLPRPRRDVLPGRSPWQNISRSTSSLASHLSRLSILEGPDAIAPRSSSTSCVHHHHHHHPHHHHIPPRPTRQTTTTSCPTPDGVCSSVGLPRLEFAPAMVCLGPLPMRSKHRGKSSHFVHNLSMLITIQPTRSLAVPLVLLLLSSSMTRDVLLGRSPWYDHLSSCVRCPTSLPRPRRDVLLGRSTWQDISCPTP